MCKYFTYLILLSLLLVLCGSTTASAVEKIWGEAEASVSMTAPLQILTDANASGGEYIVALSVTNNTNPPSTGIATYSITIAEGGVYRMYLRVRCATSGSDDDSCYVRIQGATLNLTGLTENWISDNNIDYQIANPTDWFWKQVGHYASEPGNDYAEFTMDPGTYTVEIAYREDGLDIDGFLITNETDIDPATLPDQIPSEEPAAEITNVLFSDDFEIAHDYLTDGLGDYDGLLNGTINAIDANTTRAGSLYIETDNGSWDPGPGPLLYVEMNGDFIASVKVADYAGTPEQAVYYNNCGLMARAVPTEEGEPEDWVAIDYFPLYSAGNIVRYADDGIRHEDVGGNGKGWNADVYLQIEKAGNKFYFRTSSDGKNWTDYPDSRYSPLERPDLAGRTLQVGLAQCAFISGTSYAAFDDFKIEAPVYPVLKLDLNANDDPNETQEGFTSFVLADSNGMTFDDIKVTFTGYNAADAERRSEPNGVKNENIYKDFIFAQQTEPGIGYVTLTLEGLEPNAPYNIKLYSWDSNSTGPIITDWLANDKYLLTTTQDMQDVNSVPPSGNDQAFSAFTAADSNGVIFMEAVPGEGTDPNGPFAILNALVVSSFKQTVDLGSDADTYMRDDTPRGDLGFMDIRGGNNDFAGYLRFDLSGLDIQALAKATLTLTVSGGASRNDTVVGGRFSLYGLNDVAGNTPQNWDELVLDENNVGLEWTTNNGDPLVNVTDLDDDVPGISETVTNAPEGGWAAGTTIVVTGEALVNFIQERIDGNGLVTFILKNDDSSDKGYGIATKENATEDYRPKLKLTY